MLPRIERKEIKMKIYTVATNNYGMESRMFSKRKLAEEYADWLPYYWYPTIHEIEVENELHLDKQYHVSLEIKCFYNGEKAISSIDSCRLPSVIDDYKEGYDFDKRPFAHFYTISLFHYVPEKEWKGKETIEVLRKQLYKVANEVDELTKDNPAFDVREYLEKKEIYHESPQFDE